MTGPRERRYRGVVWLPLNEGIVVAVKCTSYTSATDSGETWQLAVDADVGVPIFDAVTP